MCNKQKFKEAVDLALRLWVAFSMLFISVPLTAAPGDVLTTPITPMELPIEVEIELSPAGSLKQAATWPELLSLLQNPYAPATRRPSFNPGPDGILGNADDVPLPALNIYPLNYNFLTAQPMRLRTSDGEVSWDQPGPLFDPDEVVATDIFNTPTQLRTPIGHLVAVPLDPTSWITPIILDLPPGLNPANDAPPGSLVVLNPGGNGNNPNSPRGRLGLGGNGPSQLIPPNGTIVAVSAYFDGVLHELEFDAEGVWTGGFEPLAELEQPVNEANFFRDPADTTGVPAGQQALIGRPAARILGKALFWDMQIGSDCVQSCGSCHFHAGADNRSKNQLNVNLKGGDTNFEVFANRDNGATPADDQLLNQQVLTTDFPFHKLADITIPGEPLANPGNLLSDIDDVMSSMGVHFGKFVDSPIGGLIANASGVAVLPIDTRAAINFGDGTTFDFIPAFAGTTGNEFRRVEPRNTPTIFGSTLNFDNFWDGRARHDFNGGSVFGASDPQSHVFVNNGTAAGAMTATRQIIRFVSLASLATGPGLSEFEMSFQGRNWAKIGKKLLQAGVTPLANQLVDPTDSILGPYSNQPGNPTPTPLATAAQLAARAAGKPGLCVSYRQLIQAAFYSQLWANTSQHLTGAVNPADPFDGYVLSAPSAGGPLASDTNQFSQMEANFSLFWGLSIHLWGSILVSDDAPIDDFFEANPDAGFAIGEPGEAGLVFDLRNLVETGNFKRDPGLTGTDAAGTFTTGVGGVAGSRTPAMPDPLLGLDIFQGSNLSLKNPTFRTGRCSECHLGGNLTDHTFVRTHLLDALDFAAEFSVPGVELPQEPLGRPRLISGFLLEAEINENGQDATERRIINQSIVPNPTDGLAYPDATAVGPFGPWTGAGSSFLDNGMYNLGVVPTANDIGRGGNDPFGWPLSLVALAMKNAAGPAFVPGTPMSTFDPADPDGFAIFELTAQDQQVNPGFESELVNPLLPPWLAPWASAITVGDAHPELDEAGGAPGGMYNTLTNVPMLEGFIDILGPLNPAGTVNEAFNVARGQFQGTWPVPNRVTKDGAFKAPSIRNVELTGPYFHNGGKLTLRQELDFYSRGGDFPITNAAHRDFNLVNMKIEAQSNLTEEEEEALIDFLLELTDPRVKFDRAPFDHPEVFIPLDGTAPENTFGRPGFADMDDDPATGSVAPTLNPMFRHVAAVGAAGRATPLPNFLGISSTPVPDPIPFGFPGYAPNDHYDH